MSVLLLSLALLLFHPSPSQNAPPTTSIAQTDAAAPTILPPDQINRLLPPSVFFHGQTAPLQLRNAAAARFPDGVILFASLVDSSGYSTGVRERYQFYLVTEAPLTVGQKTLAPGAYGAGFLEDGTFVIMDMGGHDALLSRTERDDNMRRPRPLQFVTGSNAGELRLYLGRNFVSLRRASR